VLWLYNETEPFAMAPADKLTAFRTYPSSGYLFGKAWKINALPASVRPTGIGSNRLRRSGVTHEKPAVRRQEHSCPLVTVFGMAMGHDQGFAESSEELPAKL
jgi:hypothetical protein